MAAEIMPGSVGGLYEQLACERARRAREALEEERSVERLLGWSASVLEEAAAVLLHGAAAFDAVDGRLPGMFAEHAGALLAIAARFEEAADLTRSPEDRHGMGEAER